VPEHYLWFLTLIHYDTKLVPKVHAETSMLIVRLPGVNQIMCRYKTDRQQSLMSPTNTHPFNGPLSGTTRVSPYQKGKTNLDFTEARDRVATASAGPYASLLQTDTTPAPHPSVFYRPDAFPATQPTASKH